MILWMGSFGTSFRGTIRVICIEKLCQYITQSYEAMLPKILEKGWKIRNNAMKIVPIFRFDFDIDSEPKIFWLIANSTVRIRLFNR